MQSTATATYTRVSNSFAKENRDTLRENIELKKQLSQRDQEKYDYEARILELEFQLSNIGSNSNCHQNSNVVTATDSNEELEFLIAENVALKHDIDLLQKKGGVKEVSSDALECAIAESVVAKAELDALLKKFENYRAITEATLAQNRETMEEMKAAIIVYTECRDEFRAQVYAQKETIESLKATLVVLDDEKTISLARICELECEIAAVPTKVTSAPIPIPTKVTPVCRSTDNNKLIELADNINALSIKHEKDIALLNKKITLLEQQKSNLSKQLGDVNDRYNSTLAQVSDLLDQNDALTKDLAERDATVATLAEKFTTLVQRISSAN